MVISSQVLCFAARVLSFALVVVDVERGEGDEVKFQCPDVERCSREFVSLLGICFQETQDLALIVASLQVEDPDLDTTSIECCALDKAALMFFWLAVEGNTAHSCAPCVYSPGKLGEACLRAVHVLLCGGHPVAALWLLLRCSHFVRSSDGLTVSGMRWKPALLLLRVMQACTAHPSVPDPLRVRAVEEITRIVKLFPITVRHQCYQHVIKCCTHDVAVGAVVTMARLDWWQDPRGSCQLLALVADTLSGDYQIVDGADSLISALNFMRLALLSEFSKPEDVERQQWSKLLLGLAAQVDAELAVLGCSSSSTTRIHLVADLVSRCRELVDCLISRECENCRS
mmetsp:Transcript_52945/g.120687  ORF Transcript_52945/g.120687 Transcript_52945/m.120687 type:complete len:342 (-) Transcript_52945:193-1218(-)